MFSIRLGLRGVDTCLCASNNGGGQGAVRIVYAVDDVGRHIMGTVPFVIAFGWLLLAVPIRSGGRSVSTLAGYLVRPIPGIVVMAARGAGGVVTGRKLVLPAIER
ncbi:unnamed protein product, partial [Hapterophycus canaliculatus]